MRYRLLTLVVFITCFISFSAIMTGCSNEQVEKEDEYLTIGVYYNNAADFDKLRAEYTLQFERTHPHIDLNFISAVHDPYELYRMERAAPDRINELQNWIETSGADLIFLDYADYTELVQRNIFAPLDPYIMESGWELDDLAPAVLQAMRHPSDQQVYGLTPTFHSALALIYNRLIFEQTGVKLPEDRMNWDEIFQLANEISSAADGNVYGFSFTVNEAPADFYSAYQIFMHSAGLEVYDASLELQVDREEWRESWHTLIQLVHEGVMPGFEILSNVKDDSNVPAFLKGDLAMALVSYPGLLELQQIEASLTDDERYVDWEVVTAPVHSDRPNQGVEMYGLTGSGYGKIVVMNAKSSNQDTAWTFIHYLMSEQWAKIHQHRGKLYSIVSFNDLQVNEGFDLNKFIQLELPVSRSSILTQSSRRFETELMRIGQRLWNDAVAGRISVDDALEKWKLEGEQLIEQLE